MGAKLYNENELIGVYEDWTADTLDLMDSENARDWADEIDSSELFCEPDSTNELPW